MFDFLFEEPPEQLSHLACTKAEFFEGLAACMAVGAALLLLAVIAA